MIELLDVETYQSPTGKQPECHHDDGRGDTARAAVGLRSDGAQDRSSWVRLRTIILLRWFAIFGQILALTVAQRYYGLQLEIGLCYLTVGVSVIGNLIATFVFPENKRLSESQNFLMVMFDLLQLGFLLFLTGGLHNPFALLLLGPVTISAAILNLRSYLIMGSTAILIATILALEFSCR